MVALLLRTAGDERLPSASEAVFGTIEVLALKSLLSIRFEKRFKFSSTYSLKC